MTLAANTAPDVVQCQHHFPHDIDMVFIAWSDPRQLGQWFGPHSHRCTVEEYDFCEGGHYRIRMIPLQDDTDCAGEPGEDSVCAGRFIRIQQPNLIIMSFNWIEGGADMGETVLTIKFKGDAQATDIMLTHEHIPDAQLREAHHDGWRGSLQCLEAFLQN